MNIHGLKKSRKNMTRLEKTELDKGNNANPMKLNRLKKCKANCSEKIRKIKEDRKGVKK